MRTGTIPRKPETLDWKALPAFPMDHLLWSEDPSIDAYGQLCYDEEALYVHLYAKEANIRAEETGPLGEPCEDSCMEFFFCPIPGDPRYLNIEFNSNCCMYLGIATTRYNIIRMIPEDRELFAPKANRTEDGWEITYQVPYSFVRTFFPEFAPEAGKKITANFYKCGDKTVIEHYKSWNLVESSFPDFHLSQYYGELTFE